ncbi:MAG: HAD family hydrolase, partial [Clostridiales bacterium]|nr:HAD family hydrolase [Clostridiales bacterium]
MGNKIKMFVSDMDGTLLGADFAISGENIEAIRRLECAGIEFVIATGRIYSDAYSICHKSKINPYIICNNGACIFNKQQEQVYGRWLPNEGLAEIIEFMEGHKICYAISTSKEYYMASNWEALLDEEAGRLEKRGT